MPKAWPPSVDSTTIGAIQPRPGPRGPIEVSCGLRALRHRPIAWRRTSPNDGIDKPMHSE
jgi:hypothetical protein